MEIKEKPQVQAAVNTHTHTVEMFNSVDAIFIRDVCMDKSSFLAFSAKGIHGNPNTNTRLKNPSYSP